MRDRGERKRDKGGRDRDRQREWQTDRYAETDRQTNRHTNRETERWRNKRDRERANNTSTKYDEASMKNVSLYVLNCYYNRTL